MIWHETDKLFIVPWPEITKMLGRPYAFDATDDDLIRRALARAEAPEYTATCLGYYTDDGWTLVRR